jgi:hypothetical protein
MMRGRSRESIALLFVRKYVYLAFFGRPSRHIVQGGNRLSRSGPRDLPRDPGLDDERQRSEPQTDQSHETPEAAEEDADLFVPGAGPSQTEAEGMGDGSQPEHPASREELISTRDEYEGRKQKLLNVRSEGKHGKRRSGWGENSE